MADVSIINGYNLKDKEAREAIEEIENIIEEINNGSSNNTGGGNTSTGTTDGVPSANIRSFNQAYVAWCNGEEFALTFWGDSTFYGTNTSGDGYTFCAKLQSSLRQECGANVTIYKAGGPGATINGVVGEFNKLFGANGTYADTKMLGIGFGINERLNCATHQEYYQTVYENLETIINKCLNVGIQPFIVTSQATLECGVQSNYISTYPLLRNSNSINVCANTAKKDLARKYNIPLIDLNEATALYLTNSNVPAKNIISDRLHFGDIGHEFEAGYLFSEIVPRVIHIKDKDKLMLGYTNQNLKSAVPEDYLSYGGQFKVYAHYSKNDTTDTKIFDAYIFVKNRQATLQAYKNDGGSTYIKIDGTIYPMVNNVLDIGELDLGLHHLEVFTGESSTVNFNGFIINDDEYTGEMLIPVEDIALNIENGEMYVGDALQLIPNITPEDASNKKIKYTTNNSNCLVNNNGLVTALSAGDCVITATTVDGGKQASCTINVTELSLATYDTTDITGGGGAFGLDDGTVPVVLMFDYKEVDDKRSTALSGKTLNKMIIPSISQTGVLTIGKVNLNEFGTNTLTVINPKQFNVTTKNNVELDLRDFVLAENEALCISSLDDTALPVYTGATSTHAKMLMSSTFRKGSTTSSLSFKCIVYYINEEEQEG